MSYPREKAPSASSSRDQPTTRGYIPATPNANYAVDVPQAFRTAPPPAYSQNFHALDRSHGSASGTPPMVPPTSQKSPVAQGVAAAAREEKGQQKLPKNPIAQGHGQPALRIDWAAEGERIRKEALQVYHEVMLKRRKKYHTEQMLEFFDREYREKGEETGLSRAWIVISGGDFPYKPHCLPYQTGDDMQRKQAYKDLEALLGTEFARIDELKQKIAESAVILMRAALKSIENERDGVVTRRANAIHWTDFETQTFVRRTLRGEHRAVAFWWEYDIVSRERALVFVTSSRLSQQNAFQDMANLFEESVKEDKFNIGKRMYVNRKYWLNDHYGEYNLDYSSVKPDLEDGVICRDWKYEAPIEGTLNFF